MGDFSGTSKQAIASYNQLYDSAYKATLDKTNDPRKAADVAAQAGIVASTEAAAVASVIGLGISGLADLAALATKAVSAVKENAQGGLVDFIAATVGDALLIDIDPSDIKIGHGTAGSVDRATGIGQKWVDALKHFLHADGAVDGDTAEKGAAALCGIGMLMSSNTSFLAVLGGLVPQIHLDELKELGEMLEKSLGLGRLTRRGLQPLITEAVTKPLDRKYKSQFQQDILGAEQIAKAKLSGRMNESRGTELLRQHGFSDEMQAELLEQHTPRLHPNETELLAALGKFTQDATLHDLYSDGTPAQVRDARLAALTWHRLSAERGRVLSAVFSQISEGFLAPSDLDPVMARLGIPADEQELWRLAAGYAGERTRKRLSHGDILFLYEAGQVTLVEVQQWAKDEGYSDDDASRLALVFTLRAAHASSSKAGGAAARAAHAHNEHVAFVTDEITGLWGRAPSKAELDYWVNLLDMGERTKHDFVTELKALDTSGPAIPQL